MTNTDVRFVALYTLASLAAFPHGALESPISRVYECYRSSSSGTACRAAVAAGGPQAQYDWNGVRQADAAGRHRQIIPDGSLCSGGAELHKGYDLARDDWKTTAVVPDAAGNMQLVYHATAPHATRYFRFYVTRDGYNPLKPLAWTDLEPEPFCEPQWTLENGRFRMTCRAPRKSGRHLIYTIWQRADSGEAFYSCSDVVFPGGGISPPPPAAPWSELRRIVAMEPLPAGASVTLRVFSAVGAELASLAWNLPSSLPAEEWAQEFAREINAKTTIVRAGVLSPDGSITPLRSATSNTIYAQTSDFRVEIDIRKPSTPSTPVPSYPEGISSYIAGTVVKGADGKLYRCRPFPNSGWCRIPSALYYAPGTGLAWQDAWTLLP